VQELQRQGCDQRYNAAEIDVKPRMALDVRD
jgi:hypothetical protein